MKKIVALSLSALISFSSIGVSFANDDITYNRAPIETEINGITYLDGIPLIDSVQTESKLESIEDFQSNKFSSYIMMFRSNPYPYEKWSKKTNSFTYKARDRDSIDNYSKSVVHATLETESKTEYKISGSTKFGFKEIASAELSGEIGETWGKKFKIDFDVKKLTKMELESACQVMKTRWIYPYKSFGGDKAYYAYTYNKHKNVKWIHDTDLKDPDEKDSNE